MAQGHRFLTSVLRVEKDQRAAVSKIRANSSSLLQLLQFGSDLLDFAFDPPDVFRIVHLLAGTGQLHAQFLQLLVQEVDSLFRFLIHDLRLTQADCAARFAKMRLKLPWE